MNFSRLPSVVFFSFLLILSISVLFFPHPTYAVDVCVCTLAWKDGPNEEIIGDKTLVLSLENCTIKYVNESKGGIKETNGKDAFPGGGSSDFYAKQCVVKKDVPFGPEPDTEGYCGCNVIKDGQMISVKILKVPKNECNYKAQPNGLALDCEWNSSLPPTTPTADDTKPTEEKPEVNCSALKPDQCTKTAGCAYVNNTCKNFSELTAEEYTNYLKQSTQDYYSKYYKKPPGYTGPLPDCAFDGSCKNINDLLQLLINWGQMIFKIIGSVAFVAFVYGGFNWVLSMGNAERVKKGRDIMIAAVVGLIIAFSAYLMIDFFLDTLQVSEALQGVSLDK